MRTLDSITANQSNLFLCLDTQGFEGQVLSGGTKTLQNTKAMLMEFWPYGLSRTRGYEKVKEKLLQSHFRNFMVVDDSKDFMWIELTANELDRLYKKLDEEKKYTDLLLIPMV